MARGDLTLSRDLSLALPPCGGKVEESRAVPPHNAMAQEPAKRLKICFISETVHSGVGRHIADSISALAERGHEIHLLYSPIRLDPQFLSAVRNRPNVYCESLPMPREIGWRDLAVFSQIKKYVRANGPFDIIHGHSSKAGGYARLLKLFGIGPIVYTPHAFITLSPVIGWPKRFSYATIEMILAQLTNRVICESLVEAKHARKLKIAGDQIVTIGNGTTASITPPRSIVRERLGLAEDQIAVGFVGRMDDQKAPERLIAAARILLPEMRSLVFVMIGSGPKRQALETGLHRSGLGHRVLWLGHVDSRHYLPAFDMLAMPSLYEGFAYVPIEALHAGLPIIATPVGGVHETVEPGVNGFIVPHGAIHKLAQAIRVLTTDQALRRKMGEASRNHADNFSIPRMVDAMEEVYRKVIAAPAVPTSPAAMLQSSPSSSEIEAV